DPVERRAGRRQAELHLLEHDLRLSLDRQALDLAGGRIAGRDVRHEDEIAAPDGHAARAFAGFGISGQRLDADRPSVHGGPSFRFARARSRTAMAAKLSSVISHWFGACRTVVAC